MHGGGPMHGADIASKAETAGQARKSNAWAHVLGVLFRPGATFERLAATPRWMQPLLFVMAASMISAIYAVRGGFMSDMLNGMALRSGAAIEEIVSGFLAASIVMALVAVPVVSAVQAVFYMLAGRLSGGRCGYRQAFSAVCYASVPIGIGALAFAALMPITRTARAGANLAFLVDPASHPFVWSFARQLDAFSVWFFVLLGVAAVPVFGLSVVRARIAALSFAVIYLGAMTWYGSGDARMLKDPYAGWITTSTELVVIHHSPEMPKETVATAEAGLDRACRRCNDIAGPRTSERIECYLYTSLREKTRVTGSRTVAHAVPWAGIVHVAWTEGGVVAGTREMMKVVAYKTFGSVYNVFVAQGLATYAGQEWAGAPVKDAARELLESGTLPGLCALADPVTYEGLESTLSEPAGGAFVGFLAEREGLGALRDLYSAASEHAGSVGVILEGALGDSLGAIERAWREYLAEPARGGGGGR